MDRQTFLDLIPAYALGALDADEQAAFEALLQQDAEARALLADYEAVAQALAITAPARTAPAHLSDDLRQRIAASRAAEQPTPVAKSVSSTRIPPQRYWLAAAALLAVVIGVAWAVISMQPPVTQEACPDTQTLYQQIIASPDYLRIALSPGEEFTDVGGDLVADPANNNAIIHMKNLPAINPDQTFQLWLSGPDEVVSGGLFTGTGSDTCIILPLEMPLEQYNGFGVSLEQAGGSPDPNGRTGPRVVNVRLGDG